MRTNESSANIYDNICENILHELIDVSSKHIDLATMLNPSPYSEGYIAGLTMLKEHIKDYLGMFTDARDDAKRI